VIHFLFSLTHLVAASLAVATLPTWNNLLRYCMVPNLKTILLSSTWNGTGTGDFDFTTISYQNVSLAKWLWYKASLFLRASFSTAATRSPVCPSCNL